MTNGVFLYQPDFPVCKKIQKSNKTAQKGSKKSQKWTPISKWTRLTPPTQLMDQSIRKRRFSKEPFPKKVLSSCHRFLFSEKLPFSTPTTVWFTPSPTLSFSTLVPWSSMLTRERRIFSVNRNK